MPSYLHCVVRLASKTFASPDILYIKAFSAPNAQLWDFRPRCIFDRRDLEGVEHQDKGSGFRGTTVKLGGESVVVCPVLSSTWGQFPASLE